MSASDPKLTFVRRWGSARFTEWSASPGHCFWDSHPRIAILPALPCHRPAAEDNDAAALNGLRRGYGLRPLKWTFRICRQSIIATAPRNAVAMQSGPRTWTAFGHWIEAA